MARVTITYGEPRRTVVYPAAPENLSKLLGAMVNSAISVAPGVRQDHLLDAALAASGAFAGGPLVTEIFNLEALLDVNGTLSAGLSQAQGLSAQLDATGDLAANTQQDHLGALDIFALSVLTASIQTDILLGAQMDTTGDLAGDVTSQSASNDMQAAAVTYSGSGAAQSITGVGFQPDMVIILSRADTSGISVYIGDRISLGPGVIWDAQHSDGFFFEDNVTFSSTITSYDTDGFSVEDNDRVNDSSKFYLALCFKGGDQFEVIDKQNDGTSGQVVAHSLSTAPVWAFIKQPSETAGEWLNEWTVGSQHAEAFGEFFVGGGSDTLQAVSASDVTLGTDGRWNPNDTNTAALYLFGSAAISGKYETGTYTGTGGSNNAITGLGFKPEFVLVRSADDQHVFLLSEELIPDTAANLTNGDRDAAFTLDTDGFTVDSGNMNASGDQYRYFAWG